MTAQTVGSVSKPLYQYNVNMFTSTLDNVYVDMNIKICTEESVTVVASRRPKREAAQKEELDLEKIKELRKAAGEDPQESKKSFKKTMAKQESNNKKEDNTQESNNQQTGTKRRRVCFICVMHLMHVFGTTN